MQTGDITGKFALLTRQELVYLSGGLPELTRIQKSKINYKIRKKLEIFEKVELPLLLRAGFEPWLISLPVENNTDCHSFDPGSKFGLAWRGRRIRRRNRTNIPAWALLILFWMFHLQEENSKSSGPGRIRTSDPRTSRRY